MGVDKPGSGNDGQPEDVEQPSAKEGTWRHRRDQPGAPGQKSRIESWGGVMGSVTVAQEQDNRKAEQTPAEAEQDPPEEDQPAVTAQEESDTGHEKGIEDRDGGGSELREDGGQGPADGGEGRFADHFGKSPGKDAASDGGQQLALGERLAEQADKKVNAEIDDALDKVNPKFDWSKSAYSENCASVVQANELRRRGSAVEAVAAGEVPADGRRRAWRSFSRRHRAGVGRHFYRGHEDGNRGGVQRAGFAGDRLHRMEPRRGARLQRGERRRKCSVCRWSADTFGVRRLPLLCLGP